MIEWPSKRIAISDLKPYEKNPRSITLAEYDRLKDKIVRLGFNSPIIATHDLRIVSGHQRLRVLQELGVKDIEVKYAPYEMTDAQFEEALIEANISDGHWNIEMLNRDFELVKLADFGFDIRLLGKPKVDLLTDEDDTPPLNSVAVTVRGDMWIMGNHKLRCGDSTNAEDVAALLAGANPHLMVTDPPYGVEYDADWRNHTRATGTSDRAVGKVENDDRADWSTAWSLFPGEVAYVWHADKKSNIVAYSLIACDFDIRAQIIWNKSNIVISRGHYHPKHEPCWYAVRAGGTGHWQGDRKQATVWDIDKPQKSETGHSTQKPVECMRRPMENNSAPGDSVYEPFSGSGTTIIAGETCGRSVYAMELNPLYVDMAVRRWEAATGKTASCVKPGDSGIKLHN